jgi:hypothetical protein
MWTTDRIRYFISDPKSLRKWESDTVLHSPRRNCGSLKKIGTSFGVSIHDMKKYLATNDSKERALLEKGVPHDSVDNQFGYWVLYTRQINPAVQALIKGDGNVEYPLVKKVLDVLQDYNVNRFSLVTSLEDVKVELKDAKK